MAPESLEQAQKARQLDAEYENNTWEWFKKAKEDKLGFYWKFNIPEKNQEKQDCKSCHWVENPKQNFVSKFKNTGKENVPEKQIDTNNSEPKVYDPKKTILDTEILDMSDTWEENIENSIEIDIKNLENLIDSKNNLEYPILKWLHNNKQIDSETYLNILENISANPNTKVKEIISKIKIENPETKEELERLFNESNPQKNLENFNKTLKEHQIEWTEELIEVINNNSNDTIYEEIHNLIWTNFLQIDKEWNSPEKNLQIAIETAWNAILYKYPSVKRMSDTQMYKNAFIDIKSWNIKSWIEWLKSLLLLWSTLAYASWKLNKEQMKKAKWIIENKYKQRIKQIEEEISKLNEEMKKNKEKQKENTKKIDNLKKEKEEIESWELFKKAWKIDKNSEEKEEKKD